MLVTERDPHQSASANFVYFGSTVSLYCTKSCGSATMDGCIRCPHISAGFVKNSWILAGARFWYSPNATVINCDKLSLLLSHF